MHEDDSSQVLQVTRLQSEALMAYFFHHMSSGLHVAPVHRDSLAIKREAFMRLMASFGASKPAITPLYTNEGFTQEMWVAED